MLVQDEEGRYKLSGKEYTGLLQIFAAGSSMLNYQDILKPRLQAIGMWREFRLAQSCVNRLRDAILKSVPTNKLKVIAKEIQYVRLKTYINGDIANTSYTGGGVVVVDEDALIALVNEVMRLECWCCEKKDRKVKQCPIRKLTANLVPYEPNPLAADGYCTLAGCTSVLEERENNDN